MATQTKESVHSAGPSSEEAAPSHANRTGVSGEILKKGLPVESLIHASTLQQAVLVQMAKGFVVFDHLNAPRVSSINCSAVHGPVHRIHCRQRENFSPTLACAALRRASATGGEVSPHLGTF